MIFTRIWLILLAALGTLAFALALLAPQPPLQDLHRAAVENLDQAQHNADLMMRLEARDWIDTADKVARDRTLVLALEEVADGASDINRIKDRIQGRIITLVSMLKPEIRPELALIVDEHGKVIYRMGPGEDSYTPGQDGLIGYPLVEEALRGGRRDDTWNLDGKLFLMAGSPVISKARQRYVGALLLGEALDDAFARRFKLQLGPYEVAVFLRGKEVGSSFTSPQLAQVASTYQQAERRREVKEKGKTGILRLDGTAGGHYMVMTPLPGEAGVQDAFYALLKEPPPPAGLLDVIGRLTGQDLSLSAFPWPLLLGCLVVALVVGMLLLSWESSAPLDRFSAGLQRVVSGEASRLEVNDFSGRSQQRLALDINRALQRLQHWREAGAPSLSGRLPVVTPTQTPAPAAPMPAPSPTPSDAAVVEKPWAAMSQPSPAPSSPAPAPITLTPPAPIRREPSEAVRAAIPTRRPEAEGPIKAVPSGSALLSSLVSSPSSDLEDMATELERREPPFEEPGARGATVEKPSEARGPSVPEPAPSVEPAKSGLSSLWAASPTLDPTTEARGAEAEAASAAQPGPASVPEAKAPASEVAADTQEPLAEGEQDIQAIYQEFMKVKAECGEDLENLTFERFSQKLYRNRDNLIKRFGCRTVTFQVYVKDGKAALKATPIKD